ncbi:MAG: hypothetical protein EP329_16840 [Deltaproteobacteria bacterium]|nr:MAG: hypothetical protein EP329_16840 [Deltaproteobacteria bacterium]
MSPLRPLALLALFGLLGLSRCGPSDRERCYETPCIAFCAPACEDGDATSCVLTAGLTALDDIDSPQAMRAAADLARRACELRGETPCKAAEGWEDVARTLEARNAALPAEDDDPAAGRPMGP